MALPASQPIERMLDAALQEDALSREVEAMAEALAAPAWRSQPHRTQPSAPQHPPKAAEQRVRTASCVSVESHGVASVLHAWMSCSMLQRIFGSWHHRIPAACCLRCWRTTTTWPGTGPRPAGTRRTLPHSSEHSGAELLL